MRLSIHNLGALAEPGRPRTSARMLWIAMAALSMTSLAGCYTNSSGEWELCPRTKHTLQGAATPIVGGAYAGGVGGGPVGLVVGTALGIVLAPVGAVVGAVSHAEPCPSSSSRPTSASVSPSTSPSDMSPNPPRTSTSPAKRSTASATTASGGASTSSSAASTKVAPAAAAPSLPTSADVPFSVDLAGNSYEGVARLENSHITGQPEAFAKPVYLSADIKEQSVAARLTGFLDARNGNYGGPCVADGDTRPASGKVTIRMQASCSIDNPSVVLHLDLPPITSTAAAPAPAPSHPLIGPV